jgi:hypothetical protein
MLSITVHVQERNKRLGTANGTVTFKVKGDKKPIAVKFESSPHQLYVAGLGGDRIFSSEELSGNSIYGRATAAAIQLFVDAKRQRVKNATEEAVKLYEATFEELEGLLAEFD